MAQKGTTHLWPGRNIIQASKKPPSIGPKDFYLGPKGYYQVVPFRAASKLGLRLVVITTN